jgi:hypothetical protein
MNAQTNVDLISVLGEVVSRNTAFYKEDFEIDKQIFRRAAASDEPDEKRLLWLSRKCGTQCLNEREAYIRDTRDFNTWQYYAQQTDEPIIAYVVEPYHLNGEKVIGNLYKLDYREHATEMAKKAVPVGDKEVIFKDGFVAQVAINTRLGEISKLIEEHGTISNQIASAKRPERLSDVLSEQHRNGYTRENRRTREKTVDNRPAQGQCCAQPEIAATQKTNRKEMEQ